MLVLTQCALMKNNCCSINIYKLCDMTGYTCNVKMYLKQDCLENANDMHHCDSEGVDISCSWVVIVCLMDNVNC
jgi:hypothetical protein